MISTMVGRGPEGVAGRGWGRGIEEVAQVQFHLVVEKSADGTF